MSTAVLNRTAPLSLGPVKRAVAGLVSTRRDAAATVARVALGVMILPHGMQKLFGAFGGYGLEGTLGWFRSIGVPTPLALAAIAAEFLGPIALVAGLGTRAAALGLGITMIVAATQHASNGFFMNWFGNQKGEGVEFFVLAIALAVVVMIRGSGALSADRLLSSTE